MNLEDRLSTYFRAAGEQISGPELSFATLASSSAARAWWVRPLLVAGVLAGLGVLGFGALQVSGEAGLSQAWGDRELDAQPTRVIVSPFVEVRSRLTAEASTELFTVTADEPSYWRIATLNTYEDDIWKMSGDFVDFEGALPGASSGVSAETVITQNVEVADMASVWLPVAPEPFEVISDVGALSWSPTHGTLTVPNDMENSDGMSYQVLSRRSNLSADDLRAVAGEDPMAITEQYLHYVPGLDLSESASVLAEEITDGATTRYEQARLLQDYFRDFRYDLNTASTDQDPIDRLLADRAGVATDFASAFAILARDLKIPSRVAIGFTWGDPVGEESELIVDDGHTKFSVKGSHAHAWPEVYFPDIGWVPFEPTPGRGAPDAATHTGATANQAGAPQQTQD